MAKSNYLFGILSAAAVFVCGYAGGTDVVVSSQLPVVRKVQVHSNFWDLKTTCDSEIPYSEQLKKYQVSSIKYQAGAGGSEQLTRNNQQRKVKSIYDSQVGIREQGTNAGHNVEDYLRYVNLKKGEPWCAAFICWVYGQAGVDNPKSAWSPDLFKPGKVIWRRGNRYRVAGSGYQAASIRCQVSSIRYQVSSIRYEVSDMKYKTWYSTMYCSSQTTNKQQPTRAGYKTGYSSIYRYSLATINQQPTTGDIFAIWFPEKNRIAHAGFIDNWGETWLITVEGNTNLNGSREGDGVYRKRRLISSICAVASYL